MTPQLRLNIGKEKVCLSFLKSNMEEVVPTAGFTDLAKRWPEVMVKVNVSLAGISGPKASSIVEDGFGRRKRPLEEEEKDKDKEDSDSKRQRND